MVAEQAPTRPARPGRNGWVAYGVELVAIAIVYAAAAKLSLALASIHPSATPIWPPTGIALASILLFGHRIWPAILLAAFVANATTAGSLATSFAISIGNTLECVVGAYLINRWSGGIATFETPAGVARFAAICFLPSTAISPTFGVLALSLAGFAPWSDFVSIFLTWWMGDLAGALVITPMIVLWARSLTRPQRGAAQARSAVLFATAAVVGLIAFSPLTRHIANSEPLAFLAIVPLMWAALRHDQRDTATVALILAGFAIWGVLGGGGAFARSNLNNSFLLLLAFMISITVPSLALSANTVAHDRHEQHIEAVMLELSHRSKNLLTVVQSIARQVSRHSRTYDDFDRAFATRIGALASTHDLLVIREWHGADIREVIEAHLAPFRQPGEDRLTLDGPRLMLRPKAVEQLGMALHELATNATKHGALSGPTGTVSICWTVASNNGSAPHLRIDWQESGGPSPSVPRHEGFGHMVITRLAPRALDGEAVLEYPRQGVRWTLVVPTAEVAA